MTTETLSDKISKIYTYKEGGNPAIPVQFLDEELILVEDVREAIKQLSHKINDFWENSSRCRDIDETWLSPSNCDDIIKEVFGEKLTGDEK